MLTVIDAAGAGTVGDTGPITSLVTIDPVSGALSAHLTDVTPTDPTGSGVAAAEYFIDTVGAAGTGTAMAGAFPADPVTATATVAVGALSGGDHIVYVRGRDGLGNWGAVASRPFSTVSGGPATTGATVNPTSANGTAERAPVGHCRRSRRPAARTSRPPSTSSTARARTAPACPCSRARRPRRSPHSTRRSRRRVVAGLPAGGHTIFIHSQD